MATSTMEASPTKAENWSKWFESRSSATKVNQGAQEKLLQIFNADISSDECLNHLQAHQETVFMFKENFGTARVALFHHFQALGGTAYDTTKTYGIIQGVESELTVNATPDIDTLCRKPTQAAALVPTITSLLGIKKEEDINTVAAGTRSTYKPRNVIPVVPFLVDVINSTIQGANGSAKTVYVAVVTEIKRFDAEKADDDTYQDKAKTKCKDILQWLYLVARESTAVDATPVTGCNSIGIVKRLNEVTKTCTGPEPSSSPKRSREAVTGAPASADWKIPLDIIAASTSSNQDYLRKLTQIQEKGQDKTSKSFQKLPTKYQNMILVASSTGEETPVVINPQAEKFFKSSSLLHAPLFLK